MGRERLGAKSFTDRDGRALQHAARQIEISDRVTLKQDDASRLDVGAATRGAAIEQRCEGPSITQTSICGGFLGRMGNKWRLEGSSPSVHGWMI
jgi:hypothetical protein